MRVVELFVLLLCHKKCLHWMDMPQRNASNKLFEWKQSVYGSMYVLWNYVHVCVCMCAALVTHSISRIVLVYGWKDYPKPLHITQNTKHLKALPFCMFLYRKFFDRHYYTEILWTVLYTAKFHGTPHYPTKRSCFVVQQYTYSFSHITIIPSLVFCCFFLIFIFGTSNISTLYGEQIRLMRARACVFACVLCNKCKYMSNEHTYAYDERSHDTRSAFM